MLIFIQINIFSRLSNKTGLIMVVLQRTTDFPPKMCLNITCEFFDVAIPSQSG